jgi:hypothetical protein
MIRQRMRRALSIGLLALFGSSGADAAPELGEETIDRPVAHTVYWCPINIYKVFNFVADGPEITAEFTGRIRNSQTNTSLQNRIDNVCVVTKAIHDANLVTMAYDPDAPCGQFGPQAFNFPAVSPACFSTSSTRGSGPAGTQAIGRTGSILPCSCIRRPIIS